MSDRNLTPYEEGKQARMQSYGEFMPDNPYSCYGFDKAKREQWWRGWHDAGAKVISYRAKEQPR